ncbi:MAG: ABC transporter ATP-binding protein [Haloechinothrix sp.]
MIEFRDVSKEFDDGTVAVDHLDLVADNGQITVLVGPSGCGKTTSLRMVNRMTEPTAGTVLIDNEDVRRRHPAELRRGIGYVIQQAGLFPHRTVLDNIATVPRLLGWSKRRARDRAGELLQLVGLPRTMAGRYPAQLSGGQQQRVGVARALAADPPVLLMDEPFSAVDPVVREGLQDELLRLQSELAKTIVFVTHDIDEAIKLGDAVAVFRQGGELAQFAPPPELLARPANDFVSEFVGKDRGYRGLSFINSDDLRIHPLRTVNLGQPLPHDEKWLLVVDPQRQPLGWLPPAAPREVAPGGAITEQMLQRGKSLHTRGDSLRSALDAALSSPSGQGVVVDVDGSVVGGVRADDVVALLRDQQKGQSW